LFFKPFLLGFSFRCLIFNTGIFVGFVLDPEEESEQTSRGFQVLL
jgi:hypothetical protein